MRGRGKRGYLLKAVEKRTSSPKWEFVLKCSRSSFAEKRRCRGGLEEGTFLNELGGQKVIALEKKGKGESCICRERL